MRVLTDLVSGVGRLLVHRISVSSHDGRSEALSGPLLSGVLLSCLMASQSLTISSHPRIRFQHMNEAGCGGHSDHSRVLNLHS